MLVTGCGEESIMATRRGMRMIVTILIDVVMPFALVIVPITIVVPARLLAVVPARLVVVVPGTILISLVIRPILRAKCDGTDTQRECKDAERQRFQKVGSHVNPREVVVR
jgi:hypothetical protein